MATHATGRPARPLRALSWAPAWIRRGQRSVVRFLGAGERGLLVGLLVMVLTGALAMYVSRSIVTATILTIPLFVGTLSLAPRRVRLLVVLIDVVLIAETAVETYDHPLPPGRWVNVVVVLALSVFTLVVSSRRDRLGVGGLRGDAMLIDLQERIARQGVVPALPTPWYVDVAARSAEGTSFAGDFLVAHLDDHRTTLSLALVDVSGKGIGAGTRSLLLSGALGGLLGAVPADGFLGAANEFLLRQGWPEGFATAVHVRVDLDRGTFEVRSAGHPPAAQFQAGAGRWRIFDEAEGAALGLVPGAAYEPARGLLGSGDALLLYTDVLVERTRRDISLGIDKLLGQGERLVRSGFEGSAEGLVETLGSSDDDCALVVVHRR